MRKIPLVLILIAIILVGYFSMVGFVKKFDQKQYNRYISSVDTNRVKGINNDVYEIFVKHGCVYCHTQNHELPFYANLPIARQMMSYDIKQGLRRFDMEDLLMRLKKGVLVNEADLSKLDYVIKENNMPPFSFSFMHWRGPLEETDILILDKWCHKQRKEIYSGMIDNDALLQEPIVPIPNKIDVDWDKVALGQKLFHDPRLSKDNSISCATCHPLNKGGVDHLITSEGVNGAVGPINAPTVFNAAFNVHQFWDGRAATLQEQAAGPPLNPIEMASTSWEEIVKKLSTDEGLCRIFTSIYPEGITKQSITDAIAEFEKTLITPNSRFDYYLKGVEDAITYEEKCGYDLFKQYKCATCHTGASMGGKSFEIMGLAHNYYGQKDHINEVDAGRFNVTKKAEDVYRFKVPTLRNIALTAPYFHDATAKTLEDAVTKMAFYQVNVRLNKEERDKIVAYLKTLNGEFDGEILQ